MQCTASSLTANLPAPSSSFNAALTLLTHILILTADLYSALTLTGGQSLVSLPSECTLLGAIRASRTTGPGLILTRPRQPPHTRHASFTPAPSSHYHINIAPVLAHVEMCGVCAGHFFPNRRDTEPTNKSRL